MGGPRGLGPDIVEGRHAVLEALRAGVPLQRVLLAEGVREDEGVRGIEKAASLAGVPVERVARRRLDEASERGAHQGVVAEYAGFTYTPLRQMLEAVEDVRDATVVVLDHVTDPHNLGAVARSAEAVGAAGIVIAARRAAPVTPAAYKASAGAVAHVPIVRQTNIAQALTELKDAGFWVAGADQDAAETLWDAPLEGRIAIAVGSEGEGLSRLVKERCDFLVRIPQSGRVASLNVAQAATVLLFEHARRVRSEQG